jgi:hypothetical protein
MSSSSSSPVPPEGAAAGPSPLTIGKKFLKQYYQAVINTPDIIPHLYQPKESMLSHGEGSKPTECLSFEKYDVQKRWGESPPKRFELEHGAIDAQPSAGGGILLVVTGHVVLQDTTQAFVHTFLLAQIEGTKNYYVLNDVLRFLREAPSKEKDAAKAGATSDKKKEEEVAAAPAAEKTSTPAEAPAEETATSGGVEEAKATMSEEEAVEATAAVEEAKVEESSAPAAAEETASEKPKEEVETAATAQPAKEAAPKEKGGKGRKKGRSRSPPDQQKKEESSKPPAPGSWASMAARPAAANTPTKAPAAQKVAEKKVEKKVVVTSVKEKESANNKGGGGGGKNKFGKRDPDCTLVIKNLPNDAKEAELLALFEPFAARTNTKLVGTKLHRGLAFVDYDSVAPVMAAVGDHKKEPMKMGGRTLEVQQKTEEQKTRRNKAGGSGGGGNAKNGKSGGGKGNGETGRRGSGGGRDRK